VCTKSNCHNKGNQILMIAIENDHLNLVRWLIKAGADVNVIAKYGMSPLTLAVRKENLDLVRLLINAGVDVNMSNHGEGRTSLIMAVRNGQVDLIRLLIKGGADVNARDDDDCPVLMLRPSIIEIIQKVKICHVQLQ